MYLPLRSIEYNELSGKVTIVTAFMVLGIRPNREVLFFKGFKCVRRLSADQPHSVSRRHDLNASKHLEHE